MGGRSEVRTKIEDVRAALRICPVEIPQRFKFLLHV